MGSGVFCEGWYWWEGLPTGCVGSSCSGCGLQLSHLTSWTCLPLRLHVEASLADFTPVFLKVWSLDQQDQHHLKLVRNAHSQTSPPMSESESLEWVRMISVLTSFPGDYNAHWI